MIGARSAERDEQRLIAARGTLMGELRHICICLCAKCENLRCGAFGVQPDGTEPLQLEAARTDEPPAGILQAAPRDQRGDEQQL